ncbi:MAG: hypothetical protein H0X37_04320 [Herpetosiphonaceae bacterium]|nr:hypothetical protein [Herpetosiphonaceae bacterium]
MSTLASGQRRQLATLLSTIVHHARQFPTWHEPDPRNLRLWRQLLLVLVVQRSTRLLTLAQGLHVPFPTTTIKSLAQRLSYLLTTAACPLATLSPLVLRAALVQLEPRRLVRFRDHVLLVIDGTDYPKRSRGTGRANLQMQYVGRVRASTAKDSGTTTGYQDVWAGVVLRGKKFLPLQRQLFSQQHPDVRSQNQVEQAVLDAAFAHLNDLGERGIDRLLWSVAVAFIASVWFPRVLTGPWQASADQLLTQLQQWHNACDGIITLARQVLASYLGPSLGDNIHLAQPCDNTCD